MGFDLNLAPSINRDVVLLCSEAIIKHLLLLFYQDIPPHLKEGFEGYFQETMQPAVSSIGGASTVNLNAIK